MGWLGAWANDEKPEKNNYKVKKEKTSTKKNGRCRRINMFHSHCVANCFAMFRPWIKVKACRSLSKWYVGSTSKVQRGLSRDPRVSLHTVYMASVLKCKFSMSGYLEALTPWKFPEYYRLASLTEAARFIQASQRHFPIKLIRHSLQTPTGPQAPHSHQVLAA